MSMDLDHSFTVPVPPDRAWDVLLDVERIAPCMPGATVEEFDGEVVTGRIKVKVGPVSLTYRGTAKFTERDPDARVVVVDASGKETRGAGTASAAVRASLVPSGDGTQVLIHTTMNVTGRPAQFGRGVIAEVGGKLVEKFAENLAQMISDGGRAGTDGTDGAVTAGAVTAGTDGAVTAGAGVNGAAVGSASDTAAQSTAEGNGTGKVTVTTETGPGSTQPAAVVRPTAQVPAQAPVPVPASASAPSEDSINLIRLVGPAILKRVLPVAAAAAILALLGRRFRHRLQRGKNS
ncbi:MAG: SRPBCC domain-containing protein [Streptosporangiaceae bacterium]